MSRTVETPRTESPVKAHVFFNGDKGRFGLLDSENADSGIQEIAYPFRFVVLDADAFRVGGAVGLEKNDPKFKSNIAHPKYGTTLRVWLENDENTILAEGKWGNIKNNPALSKAKFTAMIYAVADFGKGKQMCCIHLHGRAYSAWLKYLQDNKLNPCGEFAFIVKSAAEMQGDKGRPSLVPVFETIGVTAETLSEADMMDTVLQAWLESQFEQSDIQAAGANRSNGAPQYRETTRQPAAAPYDDFPTQDLASYPESNTKQVPVPADEDELPF